MKLSQIEVEGVIDPDEDLCIKFTIPGLYSDSLLCTEEYEKAVQTFSYSNGLQFDFNGEFLVLADTDLTTSQELVTALYNFSQMLTAWLLDKRKSVNAA